MMKKIFSFFLVLTILATTMPYLAAPARAETPFSGTAESSIDYSKYQGYIPLVKKAIEEKNNAHSMYGWASGYGALCDIDGNGIYELVMVYWNQNFEAIWSAYSNIQGTVTPLVVDEYLCEDAAANSAYIGIVERDGNRYLALWKRGGDGGNGIDEEWKLFTLDVASYSLIKSMTARKFERLEDITACIDGKTCSKSEYEAWVNRNEEILMVYDFDEDISFSYGDITDTSMVPLEEILEKLENGNGQNSNNTVTRIYGETRYETAFKAADTLKKELGVAKFSNIVVASGTNFADALAGSYLAAQKNAPILLVRAANVNAVKDYIKANLRSGGTVYLLGGVNAVPKTMETGLDSFTVKRLGGATRYDTNLLILKEAGIDNKDIIVCTGGNFADSLSASATGLPILLVKDGLTAAQKEFLNGTSGRKIIVGGTNAVNTTVEKQLKSYSTVKRLAGSTRYETSILVAQEFFKNPTCAVLAYAQNFPDGLSGGPLAYVIGAPLILTATGKESEASKYTTKRDIHSGYVMGGPGLISDSTVQKIFGKPVRTISWRDFNTAEVRDSSGKFYGYMLQGMFNASTRDESGYSVELSFEAEKGHSPFYVDWGTDGYMYFSFLIPNDPALEGRQILTMHFDGTHESVMLVLDYLGDYSHCINTNASVDGLGWVVTDWYVIP